ncbi:MAG: hypothetical protein ACLFWF_04980 [Alphaproteobacteria bacterium]
MLIRLFLSACAAAVAATAGPAAAGPAGDPDRPVIAGAARNADNASVWMDLGYPIRSVERARRASPADVNRLKKIKPRPAAKCARIEYVYQCLSSQNMTLRRARCRAGATEASCCKAVRDHVTGKICGPVRDRFKQAGKTYNPGIFLCKCIEQARTRPERDGARRQGRPEAGERHPPDPFHPPDPIRPK